MRILTEHDVPSWVNGTLLSPTRTRTVVAVTSHHGSDRGWLDPNVLQTALGQHADVVFLATGEPTWALTEALPPRLDVYGGAIRIWWPGLTRDSDPMQHRLFFVANPARAEALLHELVEMVRQRTGASGVSTPPTPTAPPSHHAIALPPRKLLRGQVTRVSPAFVEVRAGGLIGPIVEADLPHAILVESLLVGNELTVASLGIGPTGPMFSLAGLLPNPWDRLASELRTGDVVVARVQNVHDGNKLAFADLLPGVAGVCHVREVDYGFVADIREFLAPGAIAPFEVLGIDRAAMEVQLSHKRAHGQTPRPLPGLFAGGRPFVWRADTPNFESLRQAKKRGHEPGEFVALRVLGGKDAPPATPAPDDHEPTLALQDELAALRTAHQNLVEQIRALRAQLQEAKREARSADDRTSALEQKLAAADPLASERSFLSAVRQWHARALDEDDRLKNPLQRMKVGREFLASVRATPGVEIDKVIEVCAQVAADVAYTVPGRDVHPLRAGSRGADARSRKRDGAKAWRCALKQAPSAPRLHWWNAPGDGGAVIEFACIGLHDHLDIPE